VDSLGGTVVIDNAIVAVWPRVRIGAQLSQEVARLAASLGAKAFRPLANAAMLLHTGKLAVRLATENVALLPEVAPRADLLDLVKRSIDVTE